MGETTTAQKHTQGPLETASLPGDYFGEPPCVALVGPLPDRLIIAKVFGMESLAKADAKLFAAAPDLVAACEAQEAVDAHAHGCEECQEEGGCDAYFDLDTTARNMRHAAVAKAKGESIDAR